MKLILVRHAEADDHHPKRYLGTTDLPLTEAGKRQAELLADRLASAELDFIYSSPLARARQTAAAAAARHGQDLILVPVLREIDFGEFEGLTWDEIHLRDPQAERYWTETVTMPAFPGGESAADVAGRLAPFLATLDTLPDEATVLVVCHGGSLRILLCLLLGLPAGAWTRFLCTNTGVTTVERHEHLSVLIEYNDTRHLA